MSKGKYQPVQAAPTTTRAVSEPWAPQQPHLKFGFEEARRLYEGGGPQYYPGATFTEMAPQQELALNLMENRALMGSPVQAAGQQEFLNTLGGAYTTQGNPYLGMMTERIANQVQPQVQSRFAAAGRGGSGAESSEAQRILADAIAPLAYQDYATERGRQFGAAQMAPQYAQADYADFGRLADVGAQRRAQEGMRLQDAIARFNYGQNLPQQQLGQFMGNISGNYGGTQTTAGTQFIPTQQRASPFQTLLGAGMLGASLFGPFSFGGGGLPAAAYYP